MDNFKKLHNIENGLILGNIWDPMSAVIMEQQGFKALGTTSWGIANSLGYQDGENISFSHYFHIIENILSVVKIPVSVDIESGFGTNTPQIVDNIFKLAKIGCSGINIEDSNIDGSLKSKEEFSKLLVNIKEKLEYEKFNDFFINVRTDTYLTIKNPLLETIERAKFYEKHGADGIFIPGLTKETDIKKISNILNIPLNIMSLPECTNFKKLYSYGVKRFSFGNAMSDLIISQIEDISKIILDSYDTDILYHHNNLKTEFNN